MGEAGAEPMTINWDDHSQPPRPGAIRITDDLYVTWPTDEPGPLLWHWCDRSVWKQKPDVNLEHCTPKWTPTGVQKHELISKDPLHLEPSVYWPGCCGMHGWVRNGRWEGA